MATGTAGSTAQAHYTKQTSYLSADLTVANLSPTLTFKIGTLPAGSSVLRAYTSVSVVFNSATTNNVSLGTAASGAQLVSAAAGLATLGTTSLTLVTGVVLAPTVDTEVWVTGSMSGTAATTGTAKIVLEYAL